MKRFIWIITLILFSCSDNPEDFIPHLNGYWEIEQVTLSDGTKKQYKVNETIDFINVKDGFRKKLKPGINNTYYDAGKPEALQYKIENGKLIMYYSTPFDSWKETVLSATENTLKVMTENEVIYQYKRYQPIILDVE